MEIYKRLPNDKIVLGTKEYYRPKSFVEELIDINDAYLNDNFQKAFALIDKLKTKMKSPSSTYTEEQKSALKNKLLEVLKARYKDDIMKEYTQKVQAF